MTESFKKKKLLGCHLAYEKMAALIKSERPPHAVFIGGEDGAGKRTFALHFAMALLCRENMFPCFDCPSCRKAANSNHPDIIYVRGSGKSGGIGVDDIRNVKLESFKVPQEGRKKVFIIEDSEKLTVEAQNALLKILEEPPEDTVFLLTGRYVEALLETVRSRLVVINLPIISKEERRKAIDELSGDKADEREKDLAANIFPTVGKALSVLTGSDREIFKEAVSLTDKIIIKDKYEILKLLSPYQSPKDRKNLTDLFTMSLPITVYYCKNQKISGKDMDKINKALIIGIELLNDNVNPLAVGAFVAHKASL